MASRGNCSRYDLRADRWDAPTPRQREILALAGRGLDQIGVAAALGVSHRTVSNHLTDCYRRLGVQTEPQAVVVAIARGYLDVERMAVGVGA